MSGASCIDYAPASPALTNVAAQLHIWQSAREFYVSKGRPQEIRRCDHVIDEITAQRSELLAASSGATTDNAIPAK